MLSKPAFESAARDRVVLAHLDVQATKHLKLLEQFGGDAVPTVVMTDPQGKLIGYYKGAGPDLPEWVVAMAAAWNSGYPATKPATSKE